MFPVEEAQKKLARVRKHYTAKCADLFEEHLKLEIDALVSVTTSNTIP